MEAAAALRGKVAMPWRTIEAVAVMAAESLTIRSAPMISDNRSVITVTS